jgi:hypothetical protein
VTKLLLIAIAILGVANSKLSGAPDPPMLIDNGAAPAALDAHH